MFTNEIFDMIIKYTYPEINLWYHIQDKKIRIGFLCKNYNNTIEWHIESKNCSIINEFIDQFCKFIDGVKNNIKCNIIIDSTYISYHMRNTGNIYKIIRG